MAHKKGEGSVKNGRDSHSKRLGVNEYLLTAVGGFNEAKTAIVVPGFEGSGNCIGRGDFRSRTLEFSGRRRRSAATSD